MRSLTAPPVPHPPKWAWPAQIDIWEVCHKFTPDEIRQIQQIEKDDDLAKDAEAQRARMEQAHEQELAWNGRDLHAEVAKALTAAKCYIFTTHCQWPPDAPGKVP